MSIDELPEEAGPEKQRDFGKEVTASERRKLQAARHKDRTLWFGLGMFGVIGWSVAVPTLLGVGLGLWLDWEWPGPFSWTLALLLGGVALGCLNAWYWISREQRAMEQERKEAHRE